MKKIIHLNAFSQCAAALQSFGQFRNPRDRTSQQYTSTRFWVDLARTLEAGCFDSIFFADVHGAYDVSKGSAPGIARELRVLIGCGWHVARRRCLNGVVMGAHAGSPARQPLPRFPKLSRVHTKNIANLEVLGAWFRTSRHPSRAVSRRPCAT